MRRGSLLVLAAAFLWGTTFPGTKYGLTTGGLTPVSFLFWRFLIGAIAVTAFALLWRRIDLRLFADWQLWAIGLLNGAGYLFQYVGQGITTASKTSLLVNVNVLITALLAFVLLKERIGPSLLVGIAIGFVGITLLTTNGEFTTLSGEFIGDVLAFATGIVWTVIILWVKSYLNRRPETDTVSMNVVVVGVAFLSFLVLALVRGETAYRGTDMGVWTILYLGVFSTALAFVMWQEGMRQITATVSSVLLLFETVVAMVISVAFLNERLTGWSAAGAVLVLVAMYLASRQPEGPIEPAIVVPQPEFTRPS